MRVYLSQTDNMCWEQDLKCFCPGAAVLSGEVACRGADTTGRIGHICETSGFVVNTLRLGIDS